MKPIIALIGRPNVGKSTLFNRITRRRDALVDDQPGVTRDRHYGQAVWNEKHFLLVDTGGFIISSDDDEFARQIHFQVDQAIDEAHAVVLVFDGKWGLSPFDHDMIHRLRNIDKPVFYVINKIDGPRQEEALAEFYALGLDTFHTLSAEHGYGVSDFLDALAAALPETESETPDASGQIRVAIVGRPNVGKSSLINQLIGMQRLVVSDVPGTTRDCVDIRFEHGGSTFLLIDTAGIRRKAKVDLKLEKFSIIKALKSLERCDVAFIVLDASEGITEQDIKIAGYVHERGCGSIFVANKWDLAHEGDSPSRFERRLREAAKHQTYAPFITVSARTGLRIKRLPDMARQLFGQISQRVGTGQVNRIISEAVARTEPPMHKGHRLKFYYTTQVAVRPPTFVSFVNYPDAVHFSYKRFLLNQLREGAGLKQVPVVLYFRQRSGKLDFVRTKSRHKK